MIFFHKIVLIQWNHGYTSKTGLKNLDVELIVRETYKWKTPPYNAMQSILDETVPIGRTNEGDLQLRDV